MAEEKNQVQGLKDLLMLSAKGIRENRVNIVIEDLLAESKELVMAAEKEVRRINRELLQLTDISRDSELSLKVIKDGFDSQTWFADQKRLKIELLNAQIELDVAKQLHKQWFPNDKV